MCIKEAQLLSAVNGIEGVVDVEHNAGGHLAEAVTIVIHHGTSHPQQGARVGQVLET